MTVSQCVGVDVAKDKFDVALIINNRNLDKSFSNDRKGRKDFVNWLKKHTQTPWVCMEATGHYSELIADYLINNKIRVSIVNPLQIKSFSRVKLSRNKNDIVDARIIAEYCEKMQPRDFIARSSSQKELKDLTKLLDMLKTQLLQLRNQLESTQGQLAKEALKRIIKTLELKIKTIERELSDLVKSNESLMNKMTLITSIKGVGEITAYKILAQVPDIDIFSTAKQFAAYMGVSPRQHQSGKYTGRTTISRIGDSRLRKAIYMAALTAKRYNEALKPFVNRLKENGKSPKSIVCAVMRKLAHLIFGILKHNCPFNPQLV